MEAIAARRVYPTPSRHRNGRERHSLRVSKIHTSGWSNREEMTRSEGRGGRGAAAAAVPAQVATETAISSSLLLSSSPGAATGIAANAALMLVGLPVLRRGLDTSGIANAFVLGSGVYAAFGCRGYAVMCVYFVVGTAVTKLKLRQKQREGTAEAKGGMRGWRSVWGSGIAAMICAVATVALPRAVCVAGFLASMASKLGDTTSSEVGKAYGKTTYLITTMRRVERGTEGAVSLEGTLAGIVAAAGVVCIGAALDLVPILPTVPVCVLAATIANLFESYLGATIQGKEGVAWMTNDVVNMIQVTIAAIIAATISFILLPPTS